MNTFAYKTQERKQEVYKAYDSFLNKIRIPYEEIYVDTRFGKAYVIAYGEKDLPVLVLLHGSGFNSIMWIRDMEQYSKNYRVYAVDLQGEPGKSDDKQLPFAGSDFESWLHDVFEGLKVQKAAIGGISLGAWLALKFAIAFPAMTEKLVLLCPAGVGTQRKSFLFKALFHTIMGEKGIERLYRQVNGGKPIPQEMLDYQKLLGKNFNFRKEVIPLFSDEQLKQLKMPSVLFVGEKDVMLHSLESAERFTRLVPNAKVNVLKGEGHSLVGLTGEIEEFLKE